MWARGSSWVELVVLLVLLGIGAMLSMVPLTHGRPPHVTPRSKEAESLRSIARAIEMWTQASGDRWPLEPDWSAGTTENIYWTLVQQRFFAPETLVSPAEMNPRVRPYRTGEKFTVDPSSDGISHASFAHMEPSEARAPAFLSRAATTPILSTRFPEVEGITGWRDAFVTTPFVSERSVTISYGRWIGNVAYADGHVKTESAWLDKGGVTDTWGMPTYTDGSGDTHPDLPFLDEEDDPTGTNHFLGIFTKAGRERGDFVAVYD
jgi:prepilin-type processing-associated H-X9-DG protein